MSFYKWLLKSFYDKRVIAYSRLRPITSTIWHVLLVIFIASIPFLITMNISAISGVQQLQDTLQHDLPPFQLERGTLHWESDDVYLLDEPDEGTILIDPANTYSEAELARIYRWYRTSTK